MPMVENERRGEKNAARAPNGPIGLVGVAELSHGLNSKNAYIRCISASSVGIGSNAGPASDFLALLKDEDPRMRQAAAWSLGAIASAAKDASALLRDNLKDKDVFVRCAAADALARLSPDDKKPALDLLAAALKDEDASARWLAAAVPGGLGQDGKAAVPGLIDALKDDDGYVRRKAAESLKKVDPEAAKKAGVP